MIRVLTLALVIALPAGLSGELAKVSRHVLRNRTGAR